MMIPDEYQPKAGDDTTTLISKALNALDYRLRRTERDIRQIWLIFWATIVIKIAFEVFAIWRNA